MGYINYTLKDNEIIQNRYDSMKPLKIGKKLIEPKLDCVYCKLVFDDALKLYNHIKNVHNVVKPVTIVNGKIPSQSGDYYIDHVDEVLVLMYGSKQIVLIDKLVQETSSDTYNLTEIIRTRLSHNSEVILSVGDFSLRIIKYNIYSIKNPIVHDTIKLWNQATFNNTPIRMINTDELNHAEKKYIEAFYNYFIACNATGTDKVNRYMDAYSRLQSFETMNTLAKTILKIIALKMNWIDRLEHLSFEEDIFKILIDFFHFKNPQIRLQESGQEQLFIENELEIQIRTMLNFMQRNNDEVNAYVLNKDYYLDTQDINAKDRTLFILYRYFQLIENSKNASGIIEAFTSDTLRELCKNNMNEIQGG